MHNRLFIYLKKRFRQPQQWQRHQSSSTLTKLGQSSSISNCFRSDFENDRNCPQPQACFRCPALNDVVFVCSGVYGTCVTASSPSCSLRHISSEHSLLLAMAVRRCDSAASATSQQKTKTRNSTTLARIVVVYNVCVRLSVSVCVCVSVSVSRNRSPLCWMHIMSCPM